MNAPRITETEFFALLNLDYPELGAVQAAVNARNWSAAKQALVKHIKQRTHPRWHFDWRERLDGVKKSYDTSLADRFAQNQLVSVGVWHDFGDNIDWSINPMPNQYAEWTWQLSRHGFWNTLARAYWATGNEIYAQAFVNQMNSWVRQNPVPEGEAGNGRGSRWRTIETGIRAGQTWFPAFYSFLSSPTFDDDSIVLMVCSFVEHARHLMRWPQTGNWLAMEANGLFHIGVMFPEFQEAESWRATAIERLYAELDNQVYPDGAQIELASGYHQVSLRNFEMPVKLAQLNDVVLPEDYLAKLEKMYHYNLYAAMPNGELPALNDGGWTNIRGYCEQGFQYYPHRTDMQWMATEGRRGTRPTHESYLFPWAGHAVMRSGWLADNRYLLFDIGSFGYGHQHEDKLHFVLYAYGRVHVTDPGNYPYDDSQWRRYHISAYAHNTILVDGQPQNRRGFDRRLYLQETPLTDNWKSTDSYDYAVGSYNSPDEHLPITEGYGRERNTSVTHTRQIVFVKPNYWVVFDTLTSHDAAHHSYESPFHLEAEAVQVDEASLSVVTQNPNSSNLAIVPAISPGLKLSVISGQEEPYVQGWVHEGEYGVRAIPTPTYRLSGEGVQYLAYVFYPIPEGGTCPIQQVEWLRDRSVPVGVRVTWLDGSYQIVSAGPDQKW